MNADQLREVICELYEVRPEAKEYLEFWIDPDIKKESEKYRLRIFKLFFLSEGRPRKSPNFKGLRTLLKYFSTLYVDLEKQVELRLYAFEIYFLWLETRNRVMSHHKRAESFYNDIEEFINTNRLRESYSLRLQRTQNEFTKLFERGDRSSHRGWRRWL